jgi:hypothetical protein
MFYSIRVMGILLKMFSGSKLALTMVTERIYLKVNNIPYFI